MTTPSLRYLIVVMLVDKLLLSLEPKEDIWLDVIPEEHRKFIKLNTKIKDDGAKQID